jgi:hypothetical protein
MSDLISNFIQVQSSRYSILDTTPDTEIVWSSWESHGAGHKGVSIKSSWKRLRTRILNQFQNHLLKKDQFVDDLFNIFIIYRINQDQDRFRCSFAYGPDETQIFQTNIF